MSFRRHTYFCLHCLTDNIDFTNAMSCWRHFKRQRESGENKMCLWCHYGTMLYGKHLLYFSIFFRITSLFGSITTNLCCNVTVYKMPLTFLLYLGFGKEGMADSLYKHTLSTLTCLWLLDNQLLFVFRWILIFEIWTDINNLINMNVHIENETQILFFIMGRQEMTLWNVNLTIDQ